MGSLVHRVPGAGAGAVVGGLAGGVPGAMVGAAVDRVLESDRPIALANGNHVVLNVTPQFCWNNNAGQTIVYAADSQNEHLTMALEHQAIVGQLLIDKVSDLEERQRELQEKYQKFLGGAFSAFVVIAIAIAYILYCCVCKWYDAVAEQQKIEREKIIQQAAQQEAYNYVFTILAAAVVAAMGTFFGVKYLKR